MQTLTALLLVLDAYWLIRWWDIQQKKRFSNVIIPKVYHLEIKYIQDWFCRTKEKLFLSSSILCTILDAHKLFCPTWTPKLSISKRFRWSNQASTDELQAPGGQKFFEMIFLVLLLLAVFGPILAVRRFWLRYSIVIGQWMISSFDASLSKNNCKLKYT